MFAMSKERMPEGPSSLPVWLQEALRSCFSFDTAARTSVPQLRQVGCAQLKQWPKVLPSNIQVLRTPLADLSSWDC